jgi:bifunctional non-homologous end joining protein LigD
MPLDAYRRKRDFSKTAEPAGGAPAPLDRVLAGRFVVGRHRATRLHYDLRLEIGGVLASWAVPKGPSLDPAVRRMAIHVEDHPIEYLDFEGTIPRGEYGAGDAIVWDWGTYEPEAPTLDPAASIAAGELKFRIYGQKLRGRFTLVRTRPSSSAGGRRKSGPAEPESDRDGDPWLLIHKQDADAFPGWDAEDLPASVRTGRTNDEVAAGLAPRFEASPPDAQRSLEELGALAAPFPGFIEPMLATLATQAFDDPGWLFEIKWDGYRVEAVVRDRRVSLHTRNGKDAGTYFPGLLSPPDWITADEAVVDGEVVALDPVGKPDFGLLQERLGVRFGSGIPGHARGRGGRQESPPASADPGSGVPAPLVYQAFDLLYLDGLSLLEVPLEERKRLLRSVLRESPHVRYATHVEAKGIAFLAAARERDLEGVMAKDRRSRYEPGRRVGTWLKLKIRPEQEFVVGGYLPGEGNAHDLGSVIVGYYEDGALRYAGRVGSGFDGSTRARLKRLLDAGLRSDPPFVPPPPSSPDLRGVVWSEPAIVIRVAFSNWTRDEVIRQPSFKGFELDRDPRSVRRERAEAGPPSRAAAAAPRAPRSVAKTAPKTAARTTPKATAKPGLEAATNVPAKSLGRTGRPAGGLADRATEAELAELAQLPAKASWRIGGFELSLTNLDKVLFPARAARPGASAADSTPAEQPVTKRDLIAYLSRVGPVLLAHLSERALNLQRFPDGAGGPAFWQKQIPATAPAWLRLWHETGVEDRAANDHLVADRVASLAWLGNQAAFEFHPWTARIEDVDHPTYALIDIDPGEKTTWDETLALARLFRTALAHLGLRGAPKTTGKRGIQVWVPIQRGRYTFRETTDWVEQLSRAVGAIVPELVSWEWSVAGRAGKARLDFTQNSRIKTLVAPYAVRPAAGAPVSAPIAWDELDDPDLRPDRWTIRTILPRVEALGDLFAPALEQDQELPPLG